MPEYQEGSVVQRRLAVGRSAADAEADGPPLERAVGEAPRVPESVTLLRPQQTRNSVWRWHLRRRPRAS
jgi:hypothetical protein